MGKLRDAFKTNGTLLRKALVEGDEAAVRAVAAKANWSLLSWGAFFDRARKQKVFEKATPAAVKTLVDNARGDRSVFLWGLAEEIAVAGRDDLCPAIFERLRGNEYFYQIARTILHANLKNETKADFVRKTCAQGLSFVKDPLWLARELIKVGCMAGLDVLALSGYDLRMNSDEFLRFAAAENKRDVCEHLVTRHGADLARALEIEEALGQGRALDFLRQFVVGKSLAAASTATVSMASLAEENARLRTRVDELAAVLEKIQGKQIDKPGPARLPKLT